KRFYGVYFKGFLLLLACGTVGGLLAAGVQWAYFRYWDPLGLDGGVNAPLLPMLLGGGTALIVYLGLWPDFSVRLQQGVWGDTRLGPVAVETHIRAWPLVLLVLKCVALTVLTLGLYWPHAAVALARYRIENMDVIAPAILGETVAGVSARTVAT